MGNPWGYRNKSQFQVREIDDVVEAGLFGAESHELVPIENCIVQHPDTVKVTNFVRDLLEELEIPIYEEQRNSGIVRTIVVRTGIKTGEIQLVLVTNSKKLPRKRELIERTQAAFPEVVSIMQNVNQAKTSLIFGEETLFLAGKEKNHREARRNRIRSFCACLFPVEPIANREALPRSSACHSPDR